MVDIHSEEYILGQNIRKYRLRLGWSQADLSNAVDIDRADISKYGREYLRQYAGCPLAADPHDVDSERWLRVHRG